MILSATRFALFLLAATLMPVFGAEPPIIAKARAYLGPEAALNAVTSIRYTGTLITKDPADPSRETRAAMEILFQKPDRQRITATYATNVEVTALDGYEGWQRVHEVADSSKWRQTLMRPDQVRRLRANTWENLAFFRGIEQVGGQVEDLGPATVEGVNCQKIAFTHSPAIRFTRYFELATGRLVLTETESGGSIREQGEVRVNGIRFPRSIITQSKNAKGELQAVTIEFESIYLNETYPTSYFSVPLPMPR